MSHSTGDSLSNSLTLLHPILQIVTITTRFLDAHWHPFLNASEGPGLRNMDMQVPTSTSVNDGIKVLGKEISETVPVKTEYC